MTTEQSGRSSSPAQGASAARVLSRIEVVADLRRLAREWGRDMDNELVGSALMDAAAYFEGTL